MIAETWLTGSVPAHYALRALQRIGEAIEQSRRAIESSAALGPQERATALGPIRQMGNAVERAHAGIEQADRSAVTAAASRLLRP